MLDSPIGVVDVGVLLVLDTASIGVLLVDDHGAVMDTASTI